MVEAAQPLNPPKVEHGEDDRPVFTHICDGEEIRELLPLGGGRGWTWTTDGGLTPSLHCLMCGTHGFWVGGDIPAWRSC